MTEVTVTYKAPPGDSKVTEAFGYTFFDGKAEKIEVDERVLGKLQNNPHFTVGEKPADPPDHKPHK